MDRLGSAALRDIKNRIDVEVRLSRRRRSNRVRLVGLGHVQGGAVHIRKNGNGSYAHLLAGANHTNSDFTAIRNEDLLEHRANDDCSNKAAGYWLLAPSLVLLE